jgi:hypothetical protein
MAGINRFETVEKIVNHVAVECGLTPVSDVFASGDTAFKQLTTLLTTCVQELMELYPWQIITRRFQYTTQVGENGDIDLPADFGYMIDQTGWERSENVPLVGPLSAQIWTYLLGRDLVNSTIYASFRFDQNQFRIFPNDPVPAGLDINFEYISRNLIQVAATNPIEYTDTADQGADWVMFPPNLVKRMLRMKYLEVKGFDNSVAAADFERALASWQGRDNAAPKLSSRHRNNTILLNGWRNVPDTGFGGV